MSTTPSFLPEVRTQWKSQLDSLRAANAAAQAKVDLMRGQLRRGEASDAQLNQAQLEQLQIAQRYNSFIGLDSHYIKDALDADMRLQRPNLTLMEIVQLQTKRETMYALSAEFTRFKSDNQASLMFPRPVEMDGRTYYVDGRVEWSNSLEGQAGQAWESLKELASDTVDALIRGPFTPEENYAICQSALGGLLPELAGAMLPAPGAKPGGFLWNEALGQSLNAADPAGEMCRIVYPESPSPRDLWIKGEAIEGEDPMAGDDSAMLFVPLKTLEATFLQTVGNSEVQAKWDAMAQALNAFLGKEALPYMGTPESQFAQGDGQDLIEPDDDAWDADGDVAEFVPGIDSDQLWYRQLGSDFGPNAIGGGEASEAGSWVDDGVLNMDGLVQGGWQHFLDDQADALAMAYIAPPAADRTSLAPAPYATILTPVQASSWT